MLLKIAGLVIIVLCVGQLSGYFSLMTREAGWTLAQVLGTVAMTTGPLVVLGVALWLFPGTITNKIVARESSSESKLEVRNLELVALTVLGTYFIARGITGLAYEIVLAIGLQREIPGLESIPPSVIAQTALAVAEMVVGVYLCLGAKGIIRTVERLRGES